MRYLKIKNDKVLKSLQFIKEIVEKGKGLAEEGERVEKEAARLTQEMKRLEHIRNKKTMKISEIISKEDFTKELGEFEAIGGIEIDGEDVRIEIFDVVEEYKKRYLEKKRNAKTEVEKLTK